MKKFFLSSCLFLCLILASLVVVIIVSALTSESKAIIQIDNGIAVDVRSLGEYQRTVNSVELTEAHTGNVIWSVKKKPEKRGQFHFIEIKLGSNPVIGNGWENYDVIAPKDKDTFVFERDVNYVIRVDGSKWTIRYPMPPKE